MPQDERSQARVLALQALCAFDAQGEKFDVDLESFLRDSVNHVDLGWTQPPSNAIVIRARALARGTWAQRAQCDRLLRANVAGWSVERMQPVDRNILRLGLYELLECPDVPPAVVLNEAVELARAFGGGESWAFVNGILDDLRRHLEQAGAAEPPGVSGSVGPGVGEDSDGSV